MSLEFSGAVHLPSLFCDIESLNERFIGQEEHCAQKVCMTWRGKSSQMTEMTAEKNIRHLKRSSMKQESGDKVKDKRGDERIS